MPKTKISEYSATANSNTDVASINIDEGCAPSGINNAIRAVMGHLKDFQTGTASDPLTVGGALTTSSTVTHSAGTANGVAYLNGSKVLTTGSALTFDGSKLAITAASEAVAASFTRSSTGISSYILNGGATANFTSDTSANNSFALLPSSNAATINTNGAERVRVDSSGNLGLGVTPSAWSGLSAGKLEVGSLGNALVSNGSGNLIITSNSYYNVGFKYASTAAATYYTQTLGQHQWHTAASGTAGNAISFTQAMTLDASGNLGVGTTSPTTTLTLVGSDATGKDYLAIRNDYANNSGKYAGMIFQGRDSAGTAHGVKDGGAIRVYGDDADWGGTNLRFYSRTSDSLTEKARIDSSGNLLVGTTSNLAGGTSARISTLSSLGATAGLVIQDSGTSYGAGYPYILFSNSAGSVAGNIYHSASTAVTFTQTSDKRLKTDLGTVVDVSYLDNTVVHDFEWSDCGVKDRGVFAQDEYENNPRIVQQGTDELADNGNLKTPWSVNYIGYVPDLIVYVQQLKKQIQEQQALITQLQADVAALKAA